MKPITKPITSGALALVMAAVATPAAAQYGSMGSSLPPQPQQMPDVPRQQSQPQAAPQAPQKGPQPSKKALKALIELQDAVNKNDTANIPTKLAAAQAVAQTKEDRFLIAEMRIKAAQAAKDNAALSAAIDAVAASGYNDATTNSVLYAKLGSILADAKQYPLAEAAFHKAATLNPANAEASLLLGEALLAQGRKADAIPAYQQAITIRESAHQKPDESWFKRGVSVAYEAQSPVAIDLAQKWVTTYPSPSSWNDAIAIYRNYNLGDVEAQTDLLRLKRALGILTPGEYSNLARAAAEQLTYNEARAVLDEAIAAKKIDPNSAEERDLVVGLKTKAKLTAADLAVAMKSAANAKALMRIGDNYSAIGDYANAVRAYQLAIARPDGDAALANLHIGMALARSGDKIGATTALNAVTGLRAPIAKYWLIYVNQKG